jgi:hypothetical protein
MAAGSTICLNRGTADAEYFLPENNPAFAGLKYHLSLGAAISLTADCPNSPMLPADARSLNIDTRA